MKIIEGFQSAKAILARQTTAEFYPVSVELKRRIKELFGVDDPEMAVKQIINEVRNQGDAALFDYTLRIDGIKLNSLEISSQQIANAYREVTPELLSALRLAAGRIRSFHSAQKESIFSGVTKPSSGQLIRPLQRIGVYVPGGTASYPSTVLMTTIPGRVAGVNEIILTRSEEAHV